MAQMNKNIALDLEISLKLISIVGIFATKVEKSSILDNYGECYNDLMIYHLVIVNSVICML